MNASSLRDRIKQRILILDLNVREVERMCKFSPSHLSDIMSGRKKTLKDDALSALAKILKTSVNWLQCGVGPPSTDPQDEEKALVSAAFRKLAAAQSLQSVTDGVSTVGELEDASILLIALNLHIGACSFFVDSFESGLAQGVILDPALAVPENEYARGLFACSFIQVSAKKLVRQSSDVSYAIVDAKRRN
jgi:transcriptional regulator with XRE-family HTH domain